MVLYANPCAPFEGQSPASVTVEPPQSYVPALPFTGSTTDVTYHLSGALQSGTPLSGDAYDTVRVTQYPEVVIPLHVSAKMAINTLQIDASDAMVTMEGNGDLFVGRIDAEVPLTLHTLSPVHAVETGTMQLGIGADVAIEAVDAIRIDTLRIDDNCVRISRRCREADHGTTLTLGAPAITIDTLEDLSDDQRPSVITLRADMLDIGTINLSDATRFAIEPYTPGKEVSVRIGTLRTGMKNRIDFAEGTYQLQTLETKLGLAAFTWTMHDQVIMKLQNPYVQKGAIAINADTTGGDALCDDSHFPSSLIIHAASDVHLHNKSRLVGFIYSEGSVRLKNASFVKGAVAAAHVGVDGKSAICERTCEVAATSHTQLESLAIHSLPEELMQGNSYTFEVEAAYDDGTTKLVEANVSSSDPSIVRVEENGTVTALTEGSVTLDIVFEQVQVQKSLSVYKVIHGYRLPREPDPEENDATLLGVDSNDNGVRDDVERWLLERYKNQHPIVTEVAMQGARAWQKVMENPYDAYETDKYFSAAQFCEGYFSTYASDFGHPILIHEKIMINKIPSKVLNTIDRNNAYNFYDSKLSGGSFEIPWGSECINYCDFNVTRLLGEN